MKRSIDVIEHAGEIMKKVNDAVLLTTKKDGHGVNLTVFLAHHQERRSG